ncbi:MAG: hypothetical protein JWO26_177 [Rhodospirillales bacterium]|nr:hypothetical protein [Rhodospirillales bacterium]
MDGAVLGKLGAQCSHRQIGCGRHACHKPIALRQQYQAQRLAEPTRSRATRRTLALRPPHHARHADREHLGRLATTRTCRTRATTRSRRSHDGARTMEAGLQPSQRLESDSQRPRKPKSDSVRRNLPLTREGPDARAAAATRFAAPRPKPYGSARFGRGQEIKGRSDICRSALGRILHAVVDRRPYPTLMLSSNRTPPSFAAAISLPGGAAASRSVAASTSAR